jgi:DNA-directed RNA polymerase subunit RPC12/RpoP
MTRRDLTEDEQRLLDLSGQLHEDMKFHEKDFAFGGNLQVDSSCSTLFGRFESQEDDVLVQLFPRAGEEDTYFVGEYLPKCKGCGSEVPAQNKVYKKCRRCGHTGLVYVPGRLEQKVDGLDFPSNMESIIKQACHKIWSGEVMGPEFVPELGAWVLKFRMLGSVKWQDLLDQFFGYIDQALDN